MFVLWNPVMSLSQLYTWVLLPHAESRSVLQLLDTSIASFPPGSISPSSLLNLPLAIVPDGLCSLWNAKTRLTRWLDVHQSAPTISAISLISLHCTSTISGNGSGGGGCGWRQRRRWPVWQRHTAQSALHGTSKDTKPNENKWPPMEAAPTLWARLVPLISRWLYLLSCEFLVT